MKSKTNIPLQNLQKSLQKTYGKDNYHGIKKKFIQNLSGLYNTFIEKCNDYNSETQQKRREEYISSIQDQYSKSFKELFMGIEYEEHILDDIIEGLVPQNRTVKGFINSKKVIETDYEKRDFYSIALECKSWKDFLRKETDDELYLKEKTIPVKSQEKIKAQQLQIPGATIIDEEFIDDIKTRKFSMAEFFIGKQNENCQWYGITQSWDIQREIYDKLKSVVGNCFEKEESDKVSVLIQGMGGIGKSSLIRKIAFESHLNQGFTVIWLDNFEEFFKGNSYSNTTSGWELIKNDLSNNYLLLIDDWESRVDNFDRKEVKQFLESTRKIRNIRLVIADRHIDQKEYLFHLNNEENTFELTASENRTIILQVVEKVTDWKIHIKKILSENLDNVPLFMLLFIIAKVHENKKLLNLNLSSPQNAFKEIIRDDMQKLCELKCSGFAKALHYWCCIYSEFRILISYEALLNLVEKFNKKKDKKPEDYKNLKLNSEVTRILNTYIGIKIQNEKHNHQMFYFNHDILSDGLSKVSLRGWDNFDDIQLKKILGVLVKDGDDYSASKFLASLIQKDKNIFTDQNEILDYVKILVRKGNIQPHYLFQLSELKLSDDTMVELAKLFWKEKMLLKFSSFFWETYFQQIEDETFIHNKIDKILNISQLSHYPSDFICKVLKHTKDVEIREKFSEEVINEEKLEISIQIIDSCLNYISEGLKHSFLQKKITEEIEKFIPFLPHYLECKEHSIKDVFIQKVMCKNNWKKLSNGSLFSFISLLEDKIQQESFIIKIFENIEPENSNIIRYCFLLISDKTKIKFSTNFLNKKEWQNNRGVIETCFDYAQFKMKKNIATRLLNDHSLRYFDTDLVEKFIAYAEIQSVKQYSMKILKTEEWKNYLERSITKLLTVCEDSQLKQEVSHAILNQNIFLRKDGQYLFRICLGNASHTKQQHYVNTFFKKDKYINLTPFVESVFSIAKDEEKQEFCERILQNDWNQFDHKIVLMCLEYRAKISELPDDITEQIISEYISNRNSQQYLDLFKVNLSNFQFWEKEADNILQNWKLSDNIAVTNVLFHYRNFPTKIHSVCKEILDNWSVDYTLCKFNECDWKRFEIALGHPHLKINAKKTTQLMHNIFDNEKVDVPVEFRRIVFQIVENNIYPEWEI